MSFSCAKAPPAPAPEPIPTPTPTPEPATFTISDLSSLLRVTGKAVENRTLIVKNQNSFDWVGVEIKIWEIEFDDSVNRFRHYGDPFTINYDTIKASATVEIPVSKFKAHGFLSTWWDIQIRTLISPPNSIWNGGGNFGSNFSSKEELTTPTELSLVVDTDIKAQFQVVYANLSRTVRGRLEYRVVLTKGEGQIWEVSDDAPSANGLVFSSGPLPLFRLRMPGTEQDLKRFDGELLLTLFSPDLEPVQKRANFTLETPLPPELFINSIKGYFGEGRIVSLKEYPQTSN